jgi:hypothetical protein
MYNFTMYIDIHYIYIYNKIYAPRNSKTNYSLERREYIFLKKYKSVCNIT